MENKDKRNSKKRDGSDSTFRIITVQFFACAFLTGLIAIVCRLDSSGGFREKYNEIVHNDMSVSQVMNSARDVAKSVMKPVSENNTVEITEAYSEAEETTAVSQSAGTNEEDTYEKSSERTVAQVMSIFPDPVKISPPAHGRLSSFFGYRTDPISGVEKIHSAVDIAVSEGTKVSAAWDGIVTKSGFDSTAGNYVWMVHKNGCETLYCHCSEILVNDGDVIRAGETIALSGSTGYSTGPHLHFGIKENGEMVDPLNYLQATDGIV